MSPSQPLFINFFMTFSVSLAYSKRRVFGRDTHGDDFFMNVSHSTDGTNVEVVVLFEDLGVVLRGKAKP